MNQMRRPRRLRVNSSIRSLVRETVLSVDNLIYPIFVMEGENIKEEISSMEGQYRYSVDRINEEIKELRELGIKYVILFGIPDKKDCFGNEAYSDGGIIQRAIRKIKEKYEDMYIITDICMCEYTDHGHCGILDDHGYVKNDETLEYLGRIALSHVRAGADMVAPSDMMDGRIAFIRTALDEAGYESIPIMAYSAKYASSYYGPFREAANSAPSFGDRRSYQMDPANSREAVVEGELDAAEGADILMVKPALSYLDVIKSFKNNFNIPIAAYNVSGEYAMLKLAVKNGLMKEEVIYETVLSIKRAGADIIITYFAKDIAKLLRK